MTTFTQQLKDHYHKIPRQTAITLQRAGEPDQHISYRELVHGAAGYAYALQEAGIRPGEVVIIILEHGVDLIYAFWGAVLQGAIPSILPFLTEKLSPEIYRQSLSALIDVTAPAAFLTYPAFVGEVQQAAAVVDSPSHGDSPSPMEASPPLAVSPPPPPGAPPPHRRPHPAPTGPPDSNRHADANA